MQNNNYIPDHFTKRLDFIKEILFLICSEKEISSKIIFKGGTSLTIFGGLDRFSEDLDFNLIDDKESKAIAEKIYKLLKTKYEVEELHNWDNVFCIDVLYKIDNETYSCKVEIFKNNYGIKQLYKTNSLSFNGKIININVLDFSQNFAHKCCAYLERGDKNVKNSGRPKGRDLFDINYYLDKGYTPDKNIIKARKGYNDINTLFKEIYKHFLLEHRTKKDFNSFVEEIENFSYTKVDGSSFLLNLFKKIDNKYCGGIDFNYKYKDELEEGNFFVKVNKNITIFNKKEEGYLYIKENKTDKVLLKSNKIQKVDEYVRNEIIKKI